ncbi:MAG: helix-turn-helix transcriptional regulator [Leptolyngbyaceae cyanobacterium RU_5_1]|nr:helix-turn-helix transcriptional regulator [Leptolyngbyaceae cyanobacterium RU_5_1]
MMEPLGTIVLTGDGRIQLMTRKAWDLLTQYFQVASCQESKLPENLQQWVKHQISLPTQNGKVPSSFLPLRLEHEGKCLVVYLVIAQIGEQHLLLLEEHSTQLFSITSLELMGLTKREAEVLFWVAKDKSNTEISTMLGCSNRTIKKHLEHIYEKLGARTRTSAVLRALENLGILGQP